jgi:hypothetical protein
VSDEAQFDEAKMLQIRLGVEIEQLVAWTSERMKKAIVIIQVQMKNYNNANEPRSIPSLRSLDPRTFNA